MGKHRKKCCERYLRKATACNDCPKMKDLSKKDRKKLVRRLRKTRGH